RPPSERGLEHAKGIVEHFFEYAYGGPVFNLRYIDRQDPLDTFEAIQHLLQIELPTAVDPQVVLRINDTVLASQTQLIDGEPYADYLWAQRSDEPLVNPALPMGADRLIDGVKLGQFVLGGALSGQTG
ncbi:hypothetical protein HY218_01175, partial [Candidatus Saccharibacteria bacterium]|nr:hypothetical protein [Candidatus Saccharibacteria bacterium]